MKRNFEDARRLLRQMAAAVGQTGELLKRSRQKAADARRLVEQSWSLVRHSRSLIEEGRKSRREAATARPLTPFGLSS
jgi:hypothetical protein